MEKHTTRTQQNKNYTAFVALAAIQGSRVLSDLLKKWPTEPSQDVLTDTARVGLRSALEIMFPSKEHHPFEENPLEDVCIALRFHYESNEQISERQRTPFRERYRPTPSNDDTSSRYIDRETGQESSDSDIHEEGSKQSYRKPTGLQPMKLKIINKKAFLPWEKQK
jgi:hypothetical protein